MYLTFDNLLKNETDETVIATLKRKGWRETFQPQYDPKTEYCRWQDGVWIVRPIPPDAMETR